MSESALIVGAGQGLSAALARLFHEEGMHVSLVAREAARRMLERGSGEVELRPWVERF